MASAPTRSNGEATRGGLGADVGRVSGGSDAGRRGGSGPVLGLAGCGLSGLGPGLIWVTKIPFFCCFLILFIFFFLISFKNTIF